MSRDKEKIVIEVEEGLTDEHAFAKKTKRVLVFSLGGENYAIEIAQTREVIRPIQITRVPNTPEFITGIMNLRGEVISIIDIRYFFDLEQKEKTKNIRIIITDVIGEPLGIIVDKVLDTTDIEIDSIQPPLATLKGSLAEYTKGQIKMGKNILILLDLAKIMGAGEIETLRRREK